MSGTWHWSVKTAALCGVLAFAAPGNAAAGAAAGSQRASALHSPAEREHWEGIWLGPRAFLFNGVTIASAEATPDKAPEIPLATNEYLTSYQAALQRFRDSLTNAAPVTESKFNGCREPSMPSYMLSGEYPIEIAVHDVGIYLFSSFDHDAVRRIYIDGRQHPSLDDYIINPMGHSIGHWEGDTLVVDTIGLTAGSIDILAQHSDQLHITERLRMTDPNTIEDAVTLTDPKALLQPWSSMLRYTRLQETEVIYNPCIPGTRSF